MLKKILLTSVGLGFFSVAAYADKPITDFEKKLIGTEKKMIESTGRFSVNKIGILNKSDVDKKWKMYSFEIFLTEKETNKKMTTPMIIFTDGVYQTNSLMNLSTGVKMETEELKRLMGNKQAKAKNEREFFEKSFKLDNKYYDKEHLVSGDINSKNKVVIISDPLCVACIKSIPGIYNSLKDKKDVAVFYYHFPLKGLHPTAEIVSKAIVKAKADGLKDVEIRTLEADFMKNFDVYREQDNNVALKAFNSTFGTNYTQKSLEGISVDGDMIIGKDVKLEGTPTILFNGTMYQARQNLSKFMSGK